VRQTPAGFYIVQTSSSENEGWDDIDDTIIIMIIA
jgi:hypothetical protein